MDRVEKAVIMARGLGTRMRKPDESTVLSKDQIEAVGEVELGETVVFCIRPENVILSPSSTRRSTSARNVFPGKIIKIIPMGLFYKVQLDCGFPLIAYVTAQSLEDLALKEGKEVVATFKATSIHVVRKKRGEV